MKIHVLVLTGLLLQCGSDSGSSERGGSGGGGSVDGANVSGTLAISSELAAEEGMNSEAQLNDRTVELLDETGESVAQGKTTVGGAFTLAIEANSNLKLTTTGNQGPQILKIQSLFQVTGASNEDAVGIKQQIILNPANAGIGPDGKSAIDIGTHAVKKVGAIAGKITLETNESPVGIDVYIPGSGPVVKTDADGRFLLGFLPQGSFTVRAEKDGFNSLQWDGVLVAQKQTTHLEAMVMNIAKGPKVSQFVLSELSEQSGLAVFSVKMLRASKYRVSLLQDFSDTEFRPIDVSNEEFTIKLWN